MACQPEINTKIRPHPLRQFIGIILFSCLILSIPSWAYLPVFLGKRLAGPFPVVCKPVEADPFPRIADLQPQIDFWKKIFTKYKHNQVIIHDNWYLDLIYEVVDLYAVGKNPRAVVKAKVKQYKEILGEVSQKWDTPENMGRNARILYRRLNTLNESPRFKLRDAQKRLRTQVGHLESSKKGLIWSGRYMKDIKKIFALYGLPAHLAYLPMIESAFKPSIYSHAGAAGIWQLMPLTAKQYGLTINNLFDERRDPLQATHAAARLLAHNYKKLESWPLAITAYNHGLGGIKNAVAKVKSANLWDIIQHYEKSSFQFASRNFYAEFLAAVDICTYPSKYYGKIVLDPPQNLTRFKLPHYIKAQTINNYLGVSTAQLKSINPGLKPAVFSPKRFIPKGVYLNLPAGQNFKSIYADIPDTLKYKYIDNRGWHRVRRGESLGKIAQRYKVSARDLFYGNNLRRWGVRIGQKLKIPGKYVSLDQPEISLNSPKIAVIKKPRKKASFFQTCFIEKNIKLKTTPGSQRRYFD